MSVLGRLLKERSSAHMKSDWETLSNVCSQIGGIYSAQGDYTNALKFHLEDKEVSELRNDRKGVAQAMRMIGEVYADLGDFKKSLDSQQQHLSIARELGDITEEQRALATLGRTHLYMADMTNVDELTKAKDYFAKCLTLANQIPSVDVSAGERVEMRGRAKENLGIVYWHLDNMDRADEFFRQAESDFSSARLVPDLVRLYDIQADLNIGSNLDQALQFSQKAVKTAKDERLLSNSLLTKSKILLMKKDFDQSKSELKRAYNITTKQKIVTENSEIIKNNLKMLTVIVRHQDSIDDESSHVAYEAIADALTKYVGSGREKKMVSEIALHYYKLAFARADNNGEPVTVLGPLNYSIAETHRKDLGDYESALDSFKRQLEYEAGRPEELLVTKSNIANTMDYLGESFEKVREQMLDWKKLAVETKKWGQVVSALTELAKLEDSRGRDSSETRREIEAVKEERELDDEDLISSQGSSSDNFSEVDLDQDSRDEDSEEGFGRESTNGKKTSGEKRRPRRNLTKLRFKPKNDFGEYDLHLAVKTLNNTATVRRLLEQGHPLEVKDNQGWTPLGEAVNNGIREYVEILLNAGCNINATEDRRWTPLLAASVKGHLDTIELLLERGAKVHLRSDRGDTALSYMRSHYRDGREGRDPSYRKDGVMEKIESIIKRMEEEFVKLGHDVDYSLPDEDEDDGDTTITDDQGDRTLPLHPSTLRNRTSDAGTQRPITSTQKSSMASQRRGSLPPPELSQIPRKEVKVSKATAEYKEAMDNIRSSSKNCKPNVAPLKPKNTGDSGNYLGMDQWLVEDGQDQKKRKRDSEKKTIEKKRRSENRIPKTISGNRSSDEFTPVTIDLSEDPPSPILSQPKQKRNLLSLNSRKKQLKMDQFGSRSPSPTQDQPTRLAPSASQLPVTAPSPPKHEPVTLCLNVRVCSLVLRIPVPSGGKDLTVAWLSREASTRYCKKEGSEPILKLKIDGALLDNDDPLLAVVPPGTVEIESEVLRWNNKSMPDKYKDACLNLGTTCYKNISTKLSICESTNNLTLSVVLRPSSAQPIFRAIKSSVGLRELRLVGCKIDEDLFRPLLSVLPSLTSLSVLDLKSNKLTCSCLSQLADTFQAKQPQLLQTLDLGHNPLGDLSCQHLARLISSLPSLSILSISSCSFTVSLFQSGRQELATSLASSKLSLDFSQNPVGPTGLELLLKCLPPSIRSLNISGCADVGAPLLGKHLLAYGRLGDPDLDLAILNLSNLHLVDTVVPDLGETFFHMGRLKELDLSYNSQLSCLAVADLLSACTSHNCPVTSLHLRGCHQLWDKERGDSTVFLSAVVDRLTLGQMKHLVVPDRKETGEAEQLRRAWDRAWGARSRHRVDISGHLVLTVD